MRPNKLVATLVLFLFLFNIIMPDALACWYKGNAQGYGNPNVGGKPQEQRGDNDGKPNQQSAGEPVYLHNGDFVYTNQDLFIPGRGMPVEIVRTYKSQSLYNGSFGYGWDMNYHQRIVPLSNGDALWLDGKDKRAQFSYLDGTDFISPAHLYETLKLNADGTWTLTRKDKTRLVFNQNGCLTQIVDRHNNTLAFTYSADKLPIIGVSPFSSVTQPQVIAYDWQLTKITDTVGREINLTYDTNGRLKTITDFAGRTIAYDYNTLGDLISVTHPATADFPSGTSVRYTYTQHNLETITDPKGQVYLENFYNGQDMVESQRYAGGTIYFSYDTEAKTTEVRGAKGFRTVYTFNDQGNPTKKEILTAGLRVGEPASFITRYTYNSHMELTKIIYPNGNSVTYSYGAKGNLLEIRRKPPSGSTVADIVTTFTYEPQYNFIKTAQDPKGNITTYYYDYEEATLGDLNGDGITNQNKGDLVKISYPAVGGATPVVKFTYDALGQLLSIVDPNANKVSYEYYPDTGYLKKLIQAPGILNIANEFTYDSVGNLKTLKDPKGYIYTFEYDSHNNLIKAISPAPFNYQSLYKYDANDNLIQLDRETRIAANPWQTTYYTYDILDRISSIKDDLDNLTTFTYDLNGNRNSITDTESNTTYYDYDERDLLWKVRDALGNTAEYTYDKNANLKIIKDSRANKTTYTYDTFDRLIETTYADNSKESYAYDANSNLIAKTDPKSQTITYAYDALDRLGLKTYPDAKTVDYVYDLGSRLTNAIDSSGTIRYDYDKANRITQVTYPGNRIMAYEYDANSNRTKLTYPDTTYITYTYDALNRLTYIKDQAAQAIAHYFYDALSRRTRLDLENGTQTVYAYDGINRLTSLINRLTATPTSKISQCSYTYDKVDNRKTMGTLTDTHTYTYDDIYQLKKVDYPTGFAFTDTAYNYDPVGNRVSTVSGSTTTNYTRNNLNQYTQAGSTTYGYDANGNLLSDGTSTHSYDYENRLISADKTGASFTYKYDAFGRRTQKRNNTSNAITNFIYDGDQLIAEYGGGGVLKAKYIYGPGIDEPVKMEKGGNSYYYHYDGLGSITNLTNSSGQVVETYSYDVFGKPSTTSTRGNRFMFTGREYDAETGLYYYRARFYAPRLGRFLQRDDWLGEIVNPSTLVNEYIYCANNPINWIDPMGWDKEKKEPWGKPGLTSAVSAGTKLHSDYGKAGEQFYHLIKDKWNYRFNKLGELVDHAGRVIGKAKGEAARALKYLKNIKPDFFLRIPIIIIIIPPELRRDPTSPFYDPESGGGMI